MAFFFAFLCLLAALSCQQEDGRLMTPHGYEYINHTNLEGEHPQPGEYAYFQLQIRNGDSIIHSTRAQGALPFLQIPSVNNPRRRPSPVEDVLREMARGDSATVLIRLDTLGDKPEGFENGNIMFYDVVLADIKSVDNFQEETRQEREKQREAAAEARARNSEVAAQVKAIRKSYRAGELDEKLRETPSGLKYLLLEEGTGEAVEKGRNVSVHHYGALMSNGKVYDTSFKQGEPLKFPVGEGRVIRGWDEGVALLKEGARAVFFIPYELAYGEKGSSPGIPPKAELLLYVEVVETY